MGRTFAYSVGAFIVLSGISTARIQLAHDPSDWSRDRERALPRDASKLTVSEITSPTLTAPPTAPLMTDTRAEPSTAGLSETIAVLDSFGTSTSTNTTGSAEPTISAAEPDGDGGLSTGEAAGIGVGSTLAGVIALILVGCLIHRRKRHARGHEQVGHPKQPPNQPQNQPPDQEIEMGGIGPCEHRAQV